MTSDFDRLLEHIDRIYDECLSSPKMKNAEPHEIFDGLSRSLRMLTMIIKDVIKPLKHLDVIGWADIAKALDSPESTVKNWKPDMTKKGVITYRNTGRGKDRPVASYLSLVVYKINRETEGKAGWDQKVF
jgi:hypothetical protein